MKSKIIDEFWNGTEHWELLKVNDGLIEIRMNNQIVSSHSSIIAAHEAFAATHKKNIKRTLKILDKHDFLDGSWIGAGLLEHGTPDQVIGFRFVDANKIPIVAVDLSYANALVLAGVLIKACHMYDELK